jgi:large subunit ribosomal protein L32e
MADTQRLLKQRNEQKKKKYTFIVKESKFSSGVKKRWRFPRGKHSKVRQMHRGRPVLPSRGFGSPVIVKGLTREGLIPVVVANVSALDTIDLKTQGVIIAKQVGKKKKLELLQIIIEKKLTVLNVKDAKVALDEIKKDMEERKATRKAKFESKAKKVKAAEKKAVEKAKKEAEEKVQEETNKDDKKDNPKPKSENKEVQKLEDAVEKTPSLDPGQGDEGKGQSSAEKENKQHDIINKAKN